ncbi:NAD(P)H-binding protein [Mycobacterium sp.]|uniref:NAD(P)H-binding protein n=1 Tax=Mycobacterium sp. TaxID=1785 RepID=UPI002DAFEE29|nr:NAD(P)H-binding protein [Mycobacterium sp.]
MAVIGITGASGTLGRRTAQYVLASHRPADLVLFSRRPAALAEFTDAGAIVRHADFDQPDTLATAFGGVDVLLLVSTDAVGHRRPQHEAAIKAAAAAGVSRIAYTSMSNPDSEFPIALRPLSDDHAATEDALRRAGPSWTMLRNGLYIDLLAPGWAQAGAAGTLVTNNGDGRHAPVTRDDCAAAAAAVLLGDGYDNTVYDIAGPRLLDDDAIAAVLAARYGRSVEVLHVSDEQYEKGLVAAGLPAEMTGVLTGFGASVRAGLLETPLGDIEKLLGRAPVGIEEFLAKDQAA